MISIQANYLEWIAWGGIGVIVSMTLCRIIYVRKGNEHAWYRAVSTLQVCDVPMFVCVCAHESLWFHLLIYFQLFLVCFFFSFFPILEKLMSFVCGVKTHCVWLDRMTFRRFHGCAYWPRRCATMNTFVTRTTKIFNIVKK